MVLRYIPRVKGRVKPCASVRPSYIFRYKSCNERDLAYYVLYVNKACLPYVPYTVIRSALSFGARGPCLFPPLYLCLAYVSDTEVPSLWGTRCVSIFLLYVFFSNS
jgi:hypothetical protein